MKYLVMEVFNSYAVLLDEEGRFVKSANMGYEIGETVFDPILMRETPLETIEEPEAEDNNKVTPLIPKRVLAVVTTIAAVIVLFFGMNFYQNNFVPHSSIYMAINPEVEMVLNKNGEVMDVEGTNADGEELVANYDQESENKVEVANELVDLAIEMGFLSEGGKVSIAIDAPDAALLEQYGIEMRRGLDGRLEIVIEISDLENYNKAEPEETTETQTSAGNNYDDSTYDDSVYEETTTQAPAPPPAPAETTTAAPPPVDDDSGYDTPDYEVDDYDSGYDDSGYDDDDSGYDSDSEYDD